MIEKNRTLSVLLAVLVGLIVVTSLVIGQIPKTKSRVIAPPPIYHQDVVMLGVRAAKFSGMAIHLDSPNVLLNKGEKLGLTPAQRADLQSIMDRARQEALAVLTDKQRVALEPIPADPFVFDTLDRRIQTCADAGGCPAPVVDAAPSCCPH